MKAFIPAALFCYMALSQSAQAATVLSRHVDIYFGTWDVLQQGNPTPINSLTFVEFSDHIEGGVRNLLEIDPTVDPRVVADLNTWNTLALSAIEWIVATPEGLPAATNFDASVSGLGGSITTDSGLLPGGTKTYLLATYDAGGETFNFNAEVSFFQRNGSVTLSEVPEPGTPALLGIPLAALACARVIARRRRLSH